MTWLETRRRRLGALLVLGLGGLQFVQPGPPIASLNVAGPISDHLQVPPRVDTLLRAACYDCHSHETHWPWYARISPVSWLIVRDVEHGLSNLDFSRWSTDPVVEPTPDQRLRWICRDMREGIMPPRSYLLLHPEARLSGTDQDFICDWTERTRETL